MPSDSQLNSQLLRLCLLAWFAVLLWAAVIYWFSAQSGADVEQMNLLDLWDKAAHFIAFAGGGIPMALAWRWSTKWSFGKVLLASALALSLYGAADEYHQLVTPGRSGADHLDWLADTLGGFAGSFATLLIHARTQGPHRPAPTGD